MRSHAILVVFMAVATVAALAKFLFGIFKRQDYGKGTRWVLWAFSGLNTLQWAVGVVLLITLGKFGNVAFWSHAGTMTAAVMVSYLPYRWKTSDAAIRYRHALLVVVAVLVLVVIGLLFLSGSHK